MSLNKEKTTMKNQNIKFLVGFLGLVLGWVSFYLEHKEKQA